ncbi:MAG TPA: glycosyltransferase [Gaiellaceae bacterium]|jgi:glycosyltransferase involved in cell wall biosynthesis|nr:glycosyltransferase [Gaiellaceae bacterium]
MKVLFLTASYPVPEQPLLGIFVKEHARAAARHAEVAVAHIDRNDHVRRIHIADGGDDEFPSVRARYPASPAPLSYASNIAAAGLAYRRLGREGFVPDVIHAHFFLAAVPAVLLGRLLGKPVVVTEQWSVFLPDDPMSLSPTMRRVARFAFEHADVVMPVSSALRDGIISLGTKTDFRVVPNVVDTARFHPAVDGTRNGAPRRLIGIGALYEAKGWEYLIEAIALVARTRRDFQLDLVGDGLQRGELEALVARLGVTELVAFHGWLPKEEVAERLRDSDVFVITSRYDSNPCAVIEALASGVPVVGTAVGGIPDMVADGLGLLAKPRDPESIARQIEAALDEPEAWDRAAIARTARERYGIESVGRSFASIYEEVIARAR